MKLLLVEDEVDLAKAVRRALREEGFSCDVAHDGEAGLFQALNEEYDLILLDIMLPRIDGWTVLERLRKKRDVPVLMLTARDAPCDKIRGLNDGADDYLTKPFDLDELIARIRAIIRRSAGHPDALFTVGDIEIDSRSRTVRKKGKEVILAPKEYALLELFAHDRGALVTRTRIYDHIYDGDEETCSNVVDVYVANLRRKLGKDLIRTRRGEGYMMP